MLLPVFPWLRLCGRTIREDGRPGPSGHLVMRARDAGTRQRESQPTTSQVRCEGRRQSKQPRKTFPCCSASNFRTLVFQNSLAVTARQHGLEHRPAPHRKRQPIERMIQDQALLNHVDYGLAWDASFSPVGAAGDAEKQDALVDRGWKRTSRGASMQTSRPA